MYFSIHIINYFTNTECLYFIVNNQRKYFWERDEQKATNHVLLQQLVHDVHYGRRGRRREEGREIPPQNTK